jgi:3-(methylthio)propanoyl-CoA dehydrogenase
VHCVSIEHKLGIKASPTAVLQYGDHGGAAGYLVGQENRGLEYMFIMMNAARFAVGVQGIAVAERAYQKAVAYARDRVQSRPVDGSLPGRPIIHHPDVRRMLMTMRAWTEGCRAMAAVAAAAYDAAHAHPDADARKQNQAFYEFLVPLVKGFHRDEPGGGQPGRAGARRHGLHRGDRRRAVPARRQILTIYEGTTAIQANDLVGRKTARDGGRWRGHRRPDRGHRGGTGTQRQRAAPRDGPAPGRRAQGLPGGGGLRRRPGQGQPERGLRRQVPYLMLAGTVAGWQMARALLVAEEALAAGEDAAFMRAKIATARFYADHILSACRGCATASSKAPPACRHRLAAGVAF